MRICYAGASKPSAFAIASLDEDIIPVRSEIGDVNWGRSFARTRLNADISKTTNKRIMRELFATHNVPMPKLYRWHDTDPATGSNNQMALIWAITHGQTIVGRPDKHTGGRGFWKINSMEDLRKALRGTRKKRAATHFMDFVEAPREYRVHVFKGKSIRISEKIHGTTGLTAHGDYTTAKPRHDVSHVRSAAKQAVQAVGLDFGAVDILANDTDCWVLEVNSAPGLGGSMPQLYADTFKRYFAGDWSE